MQAMNDVLTGMKNVSRFLGTARYEVIDNPDSLIEIAEWESPEARQAWLEQSMESGVLDRLIGTLGIPFKAVTVREMK
jgi:hypothetical protein